MYGAGRRFNIDSIKAQLDEKGVAVVNDVIPEDDCDQYVAELQQWLAIFGKDFPENWNSIIKGYRVNHMSACWAVRLRTKPLFSQLWGTEKLLTSYDAISIGRPPESSETKFVEDCGYNLHHDQAGTKVGFHGYQGAVYLAAAEEDDWCFTVMEGSHLHFDTFQKECVQMAPLSEWEHRPITETERDWFEEKKCQVKRISCPKGGMILWDSRTCHAGAPPMKNRKNAGRWRYVTFVNMAPAIWAREQDLRVIAEGYRGLQCGRHWAALGAVNMANGAGESQFHAVEVLPPIAKSREVRQLMGIDPYNFQDNQPNGPDWTPQVSAGDYTIP